jgi:hypothetical protein
MKGQEQGKKSPMATARFSSGLGITNMKDFNLCLLASWVH